MTDTAQPPCTPAHSGTADVGIALYDRWTQLWNGQLDAGGLMASQFRLRYAQAGSEPINDITDPETLGSYIRAFRAARPGIHFRPQGPAVVDMSGPGTGHVARPYLASIPAHGTEPDRQVSGTDILRTVDGHIVEVWSVSSPGRPFYAS